MLLLNSIKISGALLLLAIAQHATAELAKEFVLNDSGRGPYIISKLTGGHLPLTPYYDVTGVKKASEEQVKYTGKEISIGIIGADINIKKSGLLVNIPFPGDRRNSRHIPSGGVLKNIVYRQDLVGDQFDGTDHPPEITHDDEWCNKRTTRMAGIIGANSETFKGIAPNAKIGVFRVFGCRGHTTTTAVLNALNKAIRQKMNIITLPEIKYVDDKKAELEMAIEQAATAGIILIAAVEQGDSPNQDTFSTIVSMLLQLAVL
ncbi:hypothetical protein BDF22DRAFT_742425 [Syncephalis plumigaleata]|nr:hypothetical protein BDF22DRAFT_742425 [Syncephalis plumigaleata]